MDNGNVIKETTVFADLIALNRFNKTKCYVNKNVELSIVDASENAFKYERVGVMFVNTKKVYYFDKGIVDVYINKYKMTNQLRIRLKEHYYKLNIDGCDIIDFNNL